jgi:hypothetical protein
MHLRGCAKAKLPVRKERKKNLRVERRGSKGRYDMRKIALAVTAAATFLVAGSMTDRANAAIPLGLQAAIAAAAEEIDVLDTVHCRPGWRHHTPTPWRRANGCRRGRR